jgi:hypothetical protein
MMESAIVISEADVHHETFLMSTDVLSGGDTGKRSRLVTPANKFGFERDSGINDRISIWLEKKCHFIMEQD